MSTIFCSHKLRAFLGSERFAPDVTPEPSPLGDWNAHTFHIQRSRTLVFVNNRSCFCVFMNDVRKAGLQDFETVFLHRLIEQLLYERIIMPGDIQRIVGMLRPIATARTNNDKRTIGVMNEFVHMHKGQLSDWPNTNTALIERNRSSNTMPVGVGKTSGTHYIVPHEEMKALIDSSKGR